MSEWHLQNLLTSRWIDEGVLIGNRRHMLVAWEVMVPSWRINDASRYWAEPSIDFLMADADGHLIAVELKIEIPGVKPRWRVLCQVTHRAIVLSRTWSPNKLQSAYDACHSGDHGRVSKSCSQRINEDHRRFFGLDQGVRFDASSLGRVVAATAFGPRFDEVRNRFNGMDASQMVTELGRLGLLNGSPKNRDAERLRTVLERGGLPELPIEFIVVPASTDTNLDPSL